jgi:hypothetical protein
VLRKLITPKLGSWMVCSVMYLFHTSHRDLDLDWMPPITIRRGYFG